MDKKCFCRTKERREKMVEEFEIIPVAHIKLLNGQNKVSCTGDDLTDSYYCFEYRPKETSDNYETFLCGIHAANHFLELLAKEKLPLFNPLIANTPSRTKGGLSSTGDKNQLKWNPIAKNLYESINLFIAVTDIVPSEPIMTIKKNLEKYPNSRPFPSKIKSINTIFLKFFKGQTLQDMIEELRQNNNIKQYSFTILNSILSEEGIKSYFG
jgi:hypothetical protein